MVSRTTIQRLKLTATLLGSALAIAACGAAPNTATPTAAADQALEYVRCLRSHGVPNFPDPSPGGRLPNIPSDIDTSAPAFRSAEAACARLIPGGSATQNESDKASLLALARCMRAHGVPNFPDPTTSPPPAPPAGSRTGNAIGGPGAYLAFPAPSPALTRAQRACGFRLP